MNIRSATVVSVFVFLFSLAGGGAVALAGPPSNIPAGDAGPSVHSGQTMPAALRPAFYRALTKNAGAASRIGKDGCAALSKSGLKVCFETGGAHFTSAGSLALHLVAWGRSGALKPVKPVPPVIETNRVNYKHGALTAWWRVLPIGFEQGFTVAKRPAGQGELILSLAASGKARTHGDALGWGKLRYGKLVVTGARGKVVPATLKSQGNRILIAVNDAHAAYPLTVDPLVWIAQKVTASDEVKGDEFGSSVAIGGGKSKTTGDLLYTAIIGAPFASSSQGAAYIFWYIKGTWTQKARLVANGGAKGDQFGKSVAIGPLGLTVLIGAPAASSNKGEAYVFTYSNGAWTQEAKLTVEGDGRFGWSVALGRSAALIGAPYATVNDNQWQGAAYIFTDSNGVWMQAAKLTANDGEGFDTFGRSVAIDGATALAGAPAASVGGNAQQGAAYVFSDSKDTWAQTAKLTANDGAAYNNFGRAVALDGTTALVGALNATVNGNPTQGAAYIFSNSGGTWTQTQKLTASDGTAGDHFGSSVAIKGKLALVGAARSDIFGLEERDVAYMFSESTGSWSESHKFAKHLGTNDGYGSSVALNDGVALIGAPGDVNGTDRGAAYFYGEGDLALAVNAAKEVPTESEYDSFTYVTNSASVASPAVLVTVTVPAAASFVSAYAFNPSWPVTPCAVSSDVVSCDMGPTKGNGGGGYITVRYKATGKAGTTIHNTASVVGAEPPLTASAITTIAAGKPPVAQDGKLTTKKNTAASGTLKATDPEGNPLTFNIVAHPQHGTVKITDASKGTYTYTPAKDYTGSDSFTFIANDGEFDSNTATISITVSANKPPVAKDGTLTTTENTAASGTLVATDPEGDSLTYSIVAQPSHGSVTITDASSGAYTYTPTKGYSGSDSFTFKANDGELDSNVATVSVTVKPAPSSGGGGSLGWIGLAALFGLAGLAFGLRRRHA